MASPALASATPSKPQLPVSAAQLLQAGSTPSMPGIAGILQAVPASALMSSGPAVSTPAVAGQDTGATNGVTRAPSDLPGADSNAQKVASGASGLSGVSGKTGGATSGLSGLKAPTSGDLGQATGVAPSLGGLTSGVSTAGSPAITSGLTGNGS